MGLNIGYARAEKNEQERDGLSLDYQVEQLRKWSDYKDIRIEILEDGVSNGQNLDCPVMKQLLEFINKGKVDTVVVYKLDRLTKCLKDMADIEELFNKKKIKLVSLSENIDITTASGRLASHVLIGLAQWKEDTINEKMRLKIKETNNPLQDILVAFKVRVAGYCGQCQTPMSEREQCGCEDFDLSLMGTEQTIRNWAKKCVDTADILSDRDYTALQIKEAIKQNIERKD